MGLGGDPVELELHGACCSGIQSQDSKRFECSEIAPNFTELYLDRNGAVDGGRESSSKGDARCVSFGSGAEDSGVDDGTGLVSECQGLHSLVAGKVPEEGLCGVGDCYLDDRQSGCDATILEGIVSRGDSNRYVNALNCRTSLEFLKSSSPRHCDKQNENVDGSDGVLGVVEDYVNGLTEKMTETCDQAVVSLGCEMHEEFIKLSSSPRKRVEQDKQESDVISETIAVVMAGKIADLSGMENENLLRDMKERSDGLAAVEIDTHHKINSSPVFEIPAELIQQSRLPETVSKQDRHYATSGTSPGRMVEIMEQKIVNLIEIENASIQVVAIDLCDRLGGINTDAHEDLVSLQVHESTEVAARRNDFEKDNQGSCSPTEMVLAVEKDTGVEFARPENDSAVDVVEETNGSLAAIGTETHKKTPHAHCFQMSPKFVAVNCLPSNSAELDKESAEAAAVMEEKSVPLIGTDTKSQTQVLPSGEHDILSESVPMESPLSSCHQLEDLKDDPSICCPKSRTEKKSNSLAAIGSAISDELLSPIGAGKSLELISLTISKEVVKRDEQRQGESFSSLSVEQDMELKKDKSYILARSVVIAENQISSSVDHEISVADTFSKGAKKIKHRDDECVKGHLTERVILEGKGINTDITVDSYRLTLHMEGKAFELKEGLVASQCFEKPVSKQSCQHVVTSQDGSSEKLDLTCIPSVDACGIVGSSCAVDCSGDTDNERKNHASASANCASEAKYLHIISPPSERIHGVCKSSRKTQTKRTSRKSRKVPGPDGSAQIILEIARKRRSCFSKPARSSEWGSLGNITQTFKLSNVLSCDDIESHGLQKSNIGQGTGCATQNRSGRSRRRKSTGKQHTKTSCIRLKVKVGTDIGQNSSSLVIPKVVDTSSSIARVILDDGCESGCGAISEIPNITTDVQDNFRDERSKHLLQCFDNFTKEANCGSCVVDVLLTNKDAEETMFCQMSGGDAAENGVATCIEAQVSGVATEKRYTDPETSPDSEVINQVPEGQLKKFSDVNLTFSKACAAPSAVASSKKSKKKDRHPHACNQQDESTYLASLKKAKPAKKSGRRQRKCDGFFSEVPATSISATSSSNSIRSQEPVLEKSVLSTETELATSRDDIKVEIQKDEISSGPDIGLEMSESQIPNNSHLSTKSKGTCRARKSSGARKGRSKASNSARSRKASGCKESGNEPKSLNKNKVKEKGSYDHPCKDDDDPKTGKPTEDGTGKSNFGNNIASVDSANLELSSSCIMEQYLPSDDAWVRCDDCFKWRRIPVSIVDSISEANCQWICKDSMDKAFADCSIPQEKSNAEINAELGISDADANAYDFPSDDKGLECMRIPASKENEFTLITSNQFSHRPRKSQTIDEIMVCHCKTPQDRSLGCGDECLNRMLNIECVQGTCPCGNLCSNQQFQKRTYARMSWDRCGKKGFGLRMEEEISKGQFLIEYVGEVLDVHAYAARLKEYAAKGHKHFYFMTLDGSEVIDACAKGNLGRLINHSCDPNCRTEKWVVNGEICIGLFALRDIKQGEEVTFDYNYVRVVGAAAKRCYCGSPQCRGYIGGDPTNTEIIDQVDSDEEFPEPVMLEDEEAGDTFKSAMAKDKDKMDSFRKAVGKPAVTTNITDFSNQSAPAISQLNGSLGLSGVKEYSSTANFQVDLSPENEPVRSQCASAVQQEIAVEDIAIEALHSVERLEKSSSSMLEKSSSENIVANKKSKNATAEDKRVFVKSRFFIKTSRQSGVDKKGNFPSNSVHANKVPMMANKMQVLSIKPKKLVEGTSNSHFEAVQEKLNELLDAEGGINKWKDAPRGYLKLLLLTAASGASGNGESIQSNRELSMILDALLKTRSRVVLMDIINKNGLRMLHNIMKQYRRDFKKIPILRKLLKVLEYLAIREILTLEHISGGPPFPGMESFTESMLSFTEHDDKQVHQIARSFRDRWIPKHIRKRSFIDRDDGRIEFLRGSNCMWVPADHRHLNDQGVRNTEVIDCLTKPTKPATASGDTAVVHEGNSSSGTKIRKRKSRWDQPAKGSIGSSRECSHCPHCAARNYCLLDGAGTSNSERQSINEDAPPGFSSPVNPSVVSFSSLSTVDDHPQQIVKSPAAEVVGVPQSKFISRLPVSYGIPLVILQQFGSPCSESLDNWRIAPGMTFHPFPPLPPAPSVKRGSPSSAVNPVSIDESSEQGRWGSHDIATCPREDYSSITGASQSQPVMETHASSHHQGLKRTRPSSFDMGRRYFRQQKWNKLVPPWVRNRNG